MKVGAIKINSSVVTFNLMSIIVIAGLWLVDLITKNQDLVTEIFGQEQTSLIIMAVNIITIVLRNINVTGKKPIEIIRKTDTTE